ncbi:MAG: arylsulfatase, partial [Acidimicrobiales bacterium]|nr:arylsulfatase [Acidimicrobiales bacterium]
MAHDPVVAEATKIRDGLEPRFVIPEQEEAATSALDRYLASGRRPNILLIMFDDVGWGDFGCYGGGIAVGAPTPNIDRLARRGMLLTSCYSEPSCTPTRASLMTGRLPIRHGLLRPPMYGQPGGLDGEVTLPSLLSAAGYRTQAVGKWHIGENVESQPQNVGFDDFYGFLSVSDMYTEWRDPYFFPEIVYSEERTKWVENMPFNKCFVHATRDGEPEQVEEVTIPVLSLLDDKWADYSLDFIRRMAEPAPERQPWFLYHCTRGAHFDNYPHERFLGSSPAKHPYKDTIIELDDIVGRLVAELEATGQAEDTFVFLTSDNGPEMETWPDAAYSPFRSAKGSTWEGGQRVPAIAVWPGMIAADRASDGLFSLMDLFNTYVRLAGAEDSLPTDRYIDGVDQTSFLLSADGYSNRKYLYYWLTNVFSALRVGEWKFMVASSSDDDRDCLNLGGFTGVTQKYSHGRLYNLYLDP